MGCCLEKGAVQLSAGCRCVCLAPTLVLPHSYPLHHTCDPGLTSVVLPCPWHACLPPASSTHNQHPDILMLIGMAHVCLAYSLAYETRSKSPYTEYISTRWYHVLEVLLKSSDYSNPVEMWGFLVQISLDFPQFESGLNFPPLPSLFNVMVSDHLDILRLL